MRSRPAVAVSLVLSLVLVTADLCADAAKARKNLDKWDIPFTPDALMTYVFQGDTKVVRWFLEAGLPVDAVDKDGSTALQKAAEHGQTEVLSLLLEAGAGVNAGNGEALRRAAAFPEPEPLLLLLKAGAALDGQDKHGMTALCTALRFAEKNALALLQAGANPNLVCRLGRTALHEAADDGNLPVVKSMIAGAGGAAKADLEIRDGHGQTALFFAIKGEAVPVVAALLAAGADVNAKDREGVTPLHMAADSDDPAVITAVLQAGAAVNARDASGRTPLYRAANVGNVTAIPLLLAAGADPGIENDSGVSPLQIAERARYPEAARLLKEARP